jgi:hypothetical protein
MSHSICLKLDCDCCRHAAEALEAKDGEIEALIEAKERLNIQHNAEIERMRDELESIAFHTGLETARLRAALEEIEALKDSGKDWKLTDAKIIARKALEGK